MGDGKEINPVKIEALLEQLNSEAISSGYHLNPDKVFTKELIRGLLVNEERYGYRACPCRLASGDKEEDLDTICPCNYRDSDLNEYGACYCSLYVSRAVANGQDEVSYVPERRLPVEKRKTTNKKKEARAISSLPVPVWRCLVCGYLCGRDQPPEVCPICKAKKERFERFL